MSKEQITKQENETKVMEEKQETTTTSELLETPPKVKPKKIKLTEGIAHRNKDKKPGKKRVPVYIKQEHLDYEAELKKLQVELMKLQNQAQADGSRILMIFEGRDAAGKGGTIKRITAHLNARGIRVVALSKPNDRETSQWYFQRYLKHLPSAGEIVLFDRSWYNRAMVEPVMNFCTDEQHKRFLKSVPELEELLVKDGIQLFKFYFSVSKKEQKRRFESRETDMLKQYKLSPVDKLAQEYWHQYSIAKFQMLNETNRTVSPWTIVRSDNKKQARINCIKHILTCSEYEGKISKDELEPDPSYIVSGIDEICHMEENLMHPKKLHG